MIRKLKIKFILLTMLLVSIVLLCAFVFVYYSTEQNLENESLAAMKDISARNTINKYNAFIPFTLPKDDKYSYLRPFIIETNVINRTYTIDGYEISAEDIDSKQNDYLNSLISTVNESTVNEGIIKEHNLRFYSVDTLVGKRMVFLDKNYEDKTLNQLIITFSVVGSGALAAFLFISVIISRIAVAPVEKSMKQQMQLVADASHELKTPVTVISANADILISNKDEKIIDQLKWVEYIKTESARMTALINNMLFLAKTDENKKADTQYLLNLSDIVNTCTLPFESICYEKNKNLSINVQPDLFIKGNDNSIKQLIIILVDNAFKYSDDYGKIIVKLFTEQDKVHLAVWNSGTPIPPDQIPHIFERFYRIDKSRSRSQGGYGLGLSIAQSILESHNAKITVTSSAENGTSFICTFKRASSD